MKIIDFLFPFKSPAKELHYDLPHKRALIIGSNQNRLNRLNKDGSIKRKGKKTGVHASELTEAYYAFKDAQMEVDLASIKGGQIPLDPFSLNWITRTKADQRMMKDPGLQDALLQSKSVADLQASDYDLIYLAGGWAAAYDFEQSEALGQFISEAYAQNILLAAVCHGPLGFCSAFKPDGSPLVKDLKMTGVSNRQLKQLMVSHTPKHPEDSLISKGAQYQAKRHWLSDILSLHIEEEPEHRIISGQNQKAALEVADRCLQLLSD